MLALLRHQAPAGALPLPLLAGPEFDSWQSHRPQKHGQTGAVYWVDDGETVFLHLTLPHSEWSRDPAAATEQAYRQLDAARMACGSPHWWRFWNYLGGIVEGEGDAERYRQFTLGRHRAWSATGQIEQSLPAATAIGCAEGLHIFALAGRLPATSIENPRQVSAWRYPRDYGLRPPSFARASLVREGPQGWLFVSGTASIVNAETVHKGDAEKQTEQTLTNIEKLIAPENFARHGWADRDPPRKGGL